MVRPSSSPTFETRAALLRAVRTAYRTARQAPHREPTVVVWVQRFLDYHDASVPGRLGQEAVGAFLSYLATEREATPALQAEARSALEFLYEAVLQRPLSLARSYQPARERSSSPEALVTYREQSDLQVGVLLRLIQETGISPAEALRIRVRDLDLDAYTLDVRGPDEERSHRVDVPAALRNALRWHLKTVRALYEADRADNTGGAPLPNAAARRRSATEQKEAARSWAWQFVFPAPRRAFDLRSGTWRRYATSVTDLPAAA
jgi:integrase